MVKKKHPLEKYRMHPGNKHLGRYDFNELIDVLPELVTFVALNKYQAESIDFSNPLVVKTLNKALLKCYYDLTSRDVPPDYLSPPIPGKADYIHHIVHQSLRSDFDRVNNQMSRHWRWCKLCISNHRK